LNTKSSTEAELVGVNDILPQVLWTKYFFQEQGYFCADSVIYQDNKSAMLENDGRSSSNRRTCHINIHYYFITNKVKSKEVCLKHCPTENMIADFFTKPLQGAKFTTFQSFILNLDPLLLTMSLCNHSTFPVHSCDGCLATEYSNHRSVLDGQGIEASD
jgi:hypothetical protein